MSSSIGDRKTDHLALCATEDVGFRERTTLFENVRLVHNALPDLAFEELDLSCRLFGKTLRAPIVIAAMTGGTEEAGKINRLLAELAEERGLAFGLGSQRAMHKSPNTRASYAVRQVAPTALVFGNLGIVQAREMTTEAIANLVSEIGADALCIHLNPAMELVQPGGDRDFRGGLETIARLVNELKTPIIVKETGCGISRGVGERLRAIGALHVDVSGAGGTSWVGVETRRAKAAGNAVSASLGEAFWDWGIPTAASVVELSGLSFETIIATGGIQNGLDIAKAIALGAHVGGIARPMLKAVHEGGAAIARTFVERVELELRTAMLLTGSRTLSDLAKSRRVVVGELARWNAP